MYNRKFYKKYVILDCETRGFGLWGRIPAGTAALEIKNGKANVALVIQGLMPKESGKYRLYFIFDSAEGYKGLNLCEVPLSDIGTCRFKYSFDPNSISDTGYRAEDIKAAAVVLKEGNGDIISPLCGYFNENVDWRQNFSEIINDPGSEETYESRYNYNQGFYYEPIYDNGTEQTPMESTEDENTQTEGISEIEDAPIPGLNRQGILKDVKEGVQDIEPTESYYTEDYANKNASNGKKSSIDLLWDYSEKTEPFYDTNGVDWAKINIHQAGSLPLKNRSAINSPRVLLSYKKSGHFLWGRVKGDTEEMFILGVPENYHKEDASEFNSAGFYYFKPEKDEEVSEGTRGYWLLSIEDNG